MGPQAQSTNALALVAETRSQLDAIWNLSHDAFCAVTLDGVITAWNPGAERIYGYAADAVIGKPVAILVPKDRLHELSETLPTIARGGRIEHFETVRIRGDGSAIDVSLSMAPIRGAGGQVTGAIALIRDISAIQQALREAERSSVKLSEREEMLRRALLALRKSHEETKSAQLQLVQAAKLESIGRLAAGVAHEVKNPLAVILFAIDYLAETIPSPDPDMITALNDAREAVVRADTVIRGLLDFSAATELTTSVEDVNAVLERALLLVRHALTKAHVLVVEELGTDIPPAMLDRNKIEQVVVNLMINAIDAMPSGGTLVVRTRHEHLKDPGPEVGYRKTDRLRVGQSVIVVEIEDFGTGIDQGSAARLFDPFFTTKPPGKGTGLGLAVCKSIIALHGGTIRIENKKGGGGVRATIMLQSVRSQREGYANG